MNNEEKSTGFWGSINWSKFFLDFAIVCFVTFGIMYLFGLVPDELKINDTEYPDKASFTKGNPMVSKIATTTEKKNVVEIKVVGELPTRIKISAIGVDANIYNPEKTDTKTLDSFLLHGAVRYPGSGLLGDGNLFLFGHSTGFKVVNNQAYKTFSGLGKLKVGDEILVYSSDATYLYKVSSLEMKPASEVQVDLGSKKNMLTLTTCNVFSAKEDRYVVKADFVAKR